MAFRTVSVLVRFLLCDKHHEQKQLGERKGSFQLTVYSLPCRKVRAETQARNETDHEEHC